MGTFLLVIARQIGKHLSVSPNADLAVGNVIGDEHTNMLQKARGITT